MTTCRRVVAVASTLVFFLGAPDRALGQSSPPDANAPLATQAGDSAGNAADAQPPAPPAASTAPVVSPTLGATFKAVGGDLRRMFSKNSIGLAVGFGGTALAAAHWDSASVNEARELSTGLVKPGNVTGALVTQLGAGFGAFAIGKAAGSDRLALVGSQIVRAQIASQIVVQGLKFATERSRPDASNGFSFPSGHAASAFATAAVLERDFGWKVGVPAYAVGAYVAAARVGSNKHYLSDVIVGAAVGITAGRSVTVGTKRLTFDVGIAPTAGGAAVTFTKR